MMLLVIVVVIVFAQRDCSDFLFVTFSSGPLNYVCFPKTSLVVVQFNFGRFGESAATAATQTAHA